MRISDWSSDVCSSDLIAGGEVEAGRAHVVAGLAGFLHDNRTLARGAVTGLGVLLDDDGVGALGQRRAGKDAHRLAGRHLAVEEAAGRHRADHLQGCRRSEEHTSELQSLMRIAYAVFCLKKK